MNISISNPAIRALVAASALGAAFAGGVVSGQASGTTPQQPVTAQTRIVEKAPATQYVYYVVDSRQTALDAERAENMTAQERVLIGIDAPSRVVSITDNSAEGRMTALEAMLVR